MEKVKVKVEIPNNEELQNMDLVKFVVDMMMEQESDGYTVLENNDGGELLICRVGEEVLLYIRGEEEAHVFNSDSEPLYGLGGAFDIFEDINILAKALMIRMNISQEGLDNETEQMDFIEFMKALHDTTGELLKMLVDEE